MTLPTTGAPRGRPRTTTGTRTSPAPPHVLGPDYYDRFRPGYRYGFESATHDLGRTWEEAEPDLRAGWDRYEHRGEAPSAWEEIKDAVRDAWDRVVGQAGGRPGGQESGRGTPKVRE